MQAGNLLNGCSETEWGPASPFPDGEAHFPVQCSLPIISRRSTTKGQAGMNLRPSLLIWFRIRRKTAPKWRTAMATPRRGNRTTPTIPTTMRTETMRSQRTTKRIWKTALRSRPVLQALKTSPPVCRIYSFPAPNATSSSTCVDCRVIGICTAHSERCSSPTSNGRRRSKRSWNAVGCWLRACKKRAARKARSCSETNNSTSSTRRLRFWRTTSKETLESFASTRQAWKVRQELCVLCFGDGINSRTWENLMLSIIDLRHCFSPPAHKLSVAALAGNWVTRTSLSARAALKNKKQKKKQAEPGGRRDFRCCRFFVPSFPFPIRLKRIG